MVTVRLPRPLPMWVSRAAAISPPTRRSATLGKGMAINSCYSALVLIETYHVPSEHTHVKNKPRSQSSDGKRHRPWLANVVMPV